MLTLTDSKAIEDLVDFVNGPRSGISFALAMQQGTKVEIIRRQQQPCYGEMRVYNQAPGDTKPTDLHHPMPDGTPLAVALKLRDVLKEGTEGYKWWEFLIDPKLSPWRNALKMGTEAFRPLYNKGAAGFVLLDTKVDSDALVHLMQYSRITLNNGQGPNWVKMVAAGVSPIAAFVLTNQLSGGYNSHFGTWGTDSYAMPHMLDFKTVANGTPVQIVEDKDGWFFHDRKFYHRVPVGDLSRIWAGPNPDTILKHEPLSSMKQSTLEFDFVVQKVAPVVEALINGS